MKKIKQKLIQMRISRELGNKSGMEMVQVAILVAIAVAVGMIFRTSIKKFVETVFNELNMDNFS